MIIARTLALALILSVGAASAALGQSEYTTGTNASNVAAGYPSPYGRGSGAYAYDPGFRARRGGRHHAAWHASARRHGDSRFGFHPWR
jgi:hypothetical protein